jgi:hypothetical protein
MVAVKRGLAKRQLDPPIISGITWELITRAASGEATSIEFGKPLFDKHDGS